MLLLFHYPYFWTQTYKYVREESENCSILKLVSMCFYGMLLHFALYLDMLMSFFSSCNPLLNNIYKVCVHLTLSHTGYVVVLWGYSMLVWNVILLRETEKRSLISSCITLTTFSSTVAPFFTFSFLSYFYLFSLCCLAPWIWSDRWSSGFQASQSNWQPHLHPLLFWIIVYQTLMHFFWPTLKLPPLSEVANLTAWRGETRSILA